MEQSHAELRFESTNGLAEPGGTAAARPRPIPKALRTGHREEGIQVTEFHVHCSLYRTARTDYSGLLNETTALSVA
jgi:hypothetical protein